MFEQTLAIAGLSPNEAKIYEALLGTEKANISTIAIKAKVHRRNVYDCINKLVEKGLVSQVVVKNEKYFKASNPKQLLELIKDKEDAINNSLPDMLSRFQQIETKEHIYIYKGVSGFRNYLQDILELPDGEMCYYVGAKLGWFDPRLKHFLPRFLKISKQKKLKHFHLFDHDVPIKHPEIIQQLKEVNSPYKILPKEYSTNSAIDIFGDHVVTFTGLDIKQLDNDLTQFVIISKGLAESHKTWFKMMWNSLPGEKI